MSSQRNQCASVLIEDKSEISGTRRCIEGKGDTLEARTAHCWKTVVRIRSAIASHAIVISLVTTVLPGALAQAKEQVKSFAPVSELFDGVSVVYVFKRKHWFKQHPDRIYVNGKLVGAVKSGTYFPLFVRPGELRMHGTTSSKGGSDPIYDSISSTLVINVEPNEKYYVMDLIPTLRFLIRLTIPDARTVKRELPKTVRLDEPLYQGFHELDQADLFLSLARDYDISGQRKKASIALQRAGKRYDSAASSFRQVPTKKKKRSTFFKDLLLSLGPLAIEADKRRIARRLGKSNTVGIISPFENPFLSGDRFDLPADPDLLRDFSAWASSLERRSSRLDALHACYTRKEKPSLQKCSDSLENSFSEN